MDEVRVLNFARAAADVRDTWFGVGNLSAPSASIAGNNGNAPVSQTSPPEAAPRPEKASFILLRDRTTQTPKDNQVRVNGEGLAGVQGRIERNGQLLSDVFVKTADNAGRAAAFTITVGPNVRLGPAELVIFNQNGGKTSVPVQIIEPGSFAPEADTMGLWHLDEKDNQPLLANAAGPEWNLVAGVRVQPAAGRFGLARAQLDASALPNDAAQRLFNGSFTVEGWVNSQPLDGDYLLFGQGAGDNPSIALKLLASGKLQAELQDASGKRWNTQAQPPTANLTDGGWHSFALTLDREAGRLTFYVDGQPCGEALLPEGFGPLRQNGPTLHWGVSLKPDGGAFPGLLDELRLSAGSHKPEKIALDYAGHDAPLVTFIQPDANDGNAFTLYGYALNGVKAMLEGAETTLETEAVSSHQLRLKLPAAISDRAAPLRIIITDGFGQTALVELPPSGGNRAAERYLRPDPPARGLNRQRAARAASLRRMAVNR